MQPGVRLKWDKPKDDTPKADGQIMDNPSRAAAPMIYDGLDGELIRFGAHVNSIGLVKANKMSFPYDWLVYAHGRTTKLALGSNDILTGFMSGCLIATWTGVGTRYVGHVGTKELAPATNALVNSTFTRFMPSDTTGFFPNEAWDAKTEITPMSLKFKIRQGQPQIMALVTTGTHDFYSILLFRLLEKSGPSVDYCVGGIKKIPPMDRNALDAELTKRANKAAAEASKQTGT
jgi:hypothetical protein